MKVSYKETLSDPRWQKKRLVIFDRDNWTCQRCGDVSTQLHAHHIYYCNFRSPWDYPDEAITTLCKSCHEAIKDDLKDNPDRIEEWEAGLRGLMACGENGAFEFGVAFGCNMDSVLQSPRERLMFIIWLMKYKTDQLSELLPEFRERRIYEWERQLLPATCRAEEVANH